MSIWLGTTAPAYRLGLLLVLLLALGTPAGAREPDRLELPADESPGDWATPARIAGFAIAAPGQHASVLLSPGPPGQLRLTVIDGAGTPHDVLVQRPVDAGGREDVLWLADSLMHDVGLRGRARAKPPPAAPARQELVPPAPEPTLPRPTRFGLGVIGGHLLGLTGAFHPTQTVGFDLAITWRTGGWQAHADALFYAFPLTRGGGWHLGWHVGAGAFVWNRHLLAVDRPLTVGLRLPVGLDLLLGERPALHLVLEGSPDLFRRGRAVVAVELTAALRVRF